MEKLGREEYAERKLSETPVGEKGEQRGGRRWSWSCAGESGNRVSLCRKRPLACQAVFDSR